MEKLKFCEQDKVELAHKTLSAIQEGLEQIARNPIAVVNTVIYVTSHLNDVEIDDIVIRPSKQN